MNACIMLIPVSEALSFQTDILYAGFYRIAVKITQWRHQPAPILQQMNPNSGYLFSQVRVPK